MTKCPYCGTPDAYISPLFVECTNDDCDHYDVQHAYQVLSEMIKWEDTIPRAKNPWWEEPDGDTGDDEPTD